MFSLNKANFMKSKETEPYAIYFLNEQIFQQLLQDIINNSSEKRVCVFGEISENNLNDSEAILKFDNSTIRLDISRVSKNYKITNKIYFIYGNIRSKAGEAILSVNFFRISDFDFDFDAYKSIINYQRSIMSEV